MPATAMDADSLYAVLRHGTPDSRKALWDALPDSGFNEAAALATSDKPGLMLLAFVPVVVRLCGGVNPIAGKPLALATHRYAVELLEATPDHAGLLPMTLSNLALQYANACNLLGESQAALDFTERWIPYYTQLDEWQNVPALKAARINALLNAQRLDDAQRALEDPKLRGNWATDIEIARLEKLLAQLRRRITQDKGAAAAAAQASARDQPAVPAAIRNALAQMVDQTIDDPAQKRRLNESLAELLDRSPPTDASDPAQFHQLLAALAEGESYLTKGQGVDSELTVRRRIRDAAGLFVAERRPAPEKIRAALAELESSLQWARTQRHLELMNDALWGIYLCRGRLDDPSGAADALLPLRANLEADRASIADPLQRGGVFSRYPHLFAALCEQLQKAGRTAELLQAIEASKGRGVADILTRKAGRSVADVTIYAAAERLPDLTRDHDFHYLTFFVDDERTYAAFVSKAGDLHAVPLVPLGHTAIREAAAHADPRHWGRRRTPSTAERLAPLIRFLDDLLAEEVIAPGDHVCYSADEDLSNVPLHYLQLRGKPLNDFVSLSRIHGAFHLEHVLAEPATRPASFQAFVVPTRQNTERDSWTELRRYLRRPVTWLGKHLEGGVVEHESASLERLGGAELRRRVLHFSAHGMFPSPDGGGTPFDASGIVLAPEGRLPDEDRLSAGDVAGVLTPRQVLDRTLDLAGSHVSLMTCVSGLSREGLGGDALGIEWALTQAGASSLLASHWNVNAKLAAEFLERFYQHWIAERATRADALARTVAEFRHKPVPYCRPECWAAFSLTGDWR